MENNYYLTVEELLKDSNCLHDSFITEINIKFKQFSNDCSKNYPYDVQDVTIILQLPELNQPKLSMKKTMVLLTNIINISIGNLPEFEWLIEEAFFSKHKDCITFTIDKRISISSKNIHVCILQ
jgi:hypothetical protein